MNKKDEIYKKVKKALIKISIVIGISILILLFLAVPIIIFFLLKNGVEKGAEDSWAIGVGFYGALLGGLGTIIAFLVTSYQTNKIQKENIEQFNNDKRLTIKPYLDLSWYNENRTDIISINKNLLPLINNLTNFTSFQRLIEINNLGLGPAIDTKITKMTLDEVDIVLNEKNIWFNSININDKKFFGIDCQIDSTPNCTENQELYGSKNELEKKYTLSHELYFSIEYGDILDNKYIKHIYLTIDVNPILSAHELNQNTNEYLYVVREFIYLMKTNENKGYEELVKRSI